MRATLGTYGVAMNTPDQPPRNDFTRRRRKRPSRRRTLLRWLGLVAVVLLSLAVYSYVTTMLRPSSLPLTVRSVEWVRADVPLRCMPRTTTKGSRGALVTEPFVSWLIAAMYCDPWRDAKMVPNLPTAQERSVNGRFNPMRRHWHREL